MNFIEKIKDWRVNYIEYDKQEKIFRFGDHDWKTGHSDNCMTFSLGKLDEFLLSRKIELEEIFGENINEKIKNIIL